MDSCVTKAISHGYRFRYNACTRNILDTFWKYITEYHSPGENLTRQNNEFWMGQTCGHGNTCQKSKPFTSNRLLTWLWSRGLYMVLSKHRHVFRPYLASSVCCNSSRFLRHGSLSQHLAWLPEWWKNNVPVCTLQHVGIHDYGWPSVSLNFQSLNVYQLGMTQFVQQLYFFKKLSGLCGFGINVNG